MPRTNTVNAFETVTTEPVDASDTIIEVDTVDGIPEVPFYVALRPRDNENREYVRVESVAGTELNTDTISNRYLAGSAADEDQSHPVGTPVKIVVASQLFEDIWDGIDSLDLEGPVNEHEDEDDPHPQYLDESDGDARYATVFGAREESLQTGATSVTLDCTGQDDSGRTETFVHLTASDPVTVDLANLPGGSDSRVAVFVLRFDNAVAVTWDDAAFRFPGGDPPDWDGEAYLVVQCWRGIAVVSPAVEFE